MRLLVTGGSGFIGTHVVSHFAGRAQAILNVDVSPPRDTAHGDYWRRCDILDEHELFSTFDAFGPSHVLHLAARTDTEGNRVLGDYAVNTTGTSNVLEAVRATPSVSRLIVTSTQFVHQNAGQPGHDQDYSPHTVYGESKAISERITRGTSLSCIWTIVRPTNIWGPWHPRYPTEFWRVLQQGLYLHPAGRPVMRSYGYVGNVVYQLERIFEAPRPQVDRKIFYVGDMPIDLREWTDAFAIALTGNPVRVAPRLLLRSLALVGDVLLLAGIAFPIYTSRYRSMTMNNPAPMEATFDAFGPPPYSLQDGVEQTVEWLVKEGYTLRAGSPSRP